MLLIPLASCDNTPPEQVAVKGDGFEITLAELEQMLGQAPPQPADRVAAARREILNGLIDEKLLAEAAAKDGLDKSTATVQAIEAAKRSILAQAYVAKLAGQPSPPEESRLRGYYDSHPQLFARRERFHIAEVSLPADQADASTVTELDRLGFDQFVARLEADGKAPTVVNTTLMNDEVPAGKMAVGSNVFYSTPGYVHLGKITAVDPAPIDYQNAKPGLAQRVLNEQTQSVVAAIVARLRKDRHVEVVNKDLKRGMH
ncbi:MAG: EpsD family peptidyl-prolyl cis-trans isomerase [Novosphingobium sp.]